MTRRPAALHPVALVTRWEGFCLPCGSDARPLALTWTGPRGLRAWLSGSGWHDGELRLTCACCGGVDVVGWEDEPEPVLEVEVEVEVEQPVLAELPAPVALPAPAVAAAVAPALPAPRVPAPPVVRVVRVLDLDTPDAVAVHGVAEVPPARLPSRSERRAAARGGQPLPAGAEDDDALDLLHLVG